MNQALSTEVIVGGNQNHSSVEMIGPKNDSLNKQSMPAIGGTLKSMNGDMIGITLNEADRRN